MMVIDPSTGLLGLPGQSWGEYDAELCKQHGWIKTAYGANMTLPEKEIELNEEEKAIADKAAKLIARDYGEVLKRLGDE